MKNRILTLLAGLIIGATVFSLPPVHALVENQAFGIFGVTPVTTQPAGAAQAALTDSTGGTASTTLASITAGASYSQADMVAVKNSLASQAALLNALRAAMVSLGLIKGGA